MRASAVVAIALAGCALPPPATEPGAKPSYNRRELESRPGVFTGEDGVWTIYRSDAPAPPPPPPRPTTLSCERGHVCDPPPEADESPAR